MPKRSSGHSPRKNDDELVEIAAEQLANLLWKHWVFKNSLRELKPRTSSPKHLDKGINAERT